MDYSHMTGTMAVGLIVGFIVAVLIGAAVLSLVNRIVNGFWAPYGRALGTVVVVGIIDAIVGYIIVKIMGPSHFGVRLVIGIVVETLVGGAIMNVFVRRPDGSPLGFKRAALVFLILAILSALLGAGMHRLGESMQANMSNMQAQ